MNTPQKYDFEDFIFEVYGKDAFSLGFDYPNKDRLCPFELIIQKDVVRDMYYDEYPDSEVDFEVFSNEVEHRRDWTKFFKKAVKELLNYNEDSELPKLKVRLDQYMQEAQVLRKTMFDQAAKIRRLEADLIEASKPTTIIRQSAINEMHSFNCRVKKQG